VAAGKHCLYLAAGLAVALLVCGRAPAAVVRDGTVGPPATVQPVGPAYVIPETMGHLQGVNLFHSFAQFDLTSSQSATFTAVSPVDNVISRVTGGSLSSIDGTLTSAIPGADFFFINPNGVMLGPNAQIHVDGSLHFSTADALRFQDGAVFYADPTRGSVLTSSPPSAFGFLAPNAASITIQSQLVPAAGTLTIPSDATLTFVGGGIDMSAAVLGAPPNRINLASVASAGDATLEGGGIDVSGFSELGDIRLDAGSLVDSKEVFIRGGRLVIQDAIISPGSLSLFGLGPSSNGGQVDVRVSGDLEISGSGTLFGSLTPGILTFTSLAGGVVPSIRVQAGGAATLTGFAAISSQKGGIGSPGAVDVSAHSLSVLDGAQINTINFAGGPGPSLAVTADSLLLSGAGSALTAQSQDAAGFFLTDAGSLAVTADQLTVARGAEITTDSFTFGSGGKLTVIAGDAVLSGTGKIASQSVIAGNAGDIEIHARTLTLGDSFQISATTAGVGDAGKVAVAASGSIAVSGSNSGIFSTAFDVRPSDLDHYANFVGLANFADLLPLVGVTSLDELLGALGIDDSPGNAGTISIATPSLRMSGDTRVDSSTFGDGNAGGVVANLGALALMDGAQIRSRSGGILRTTGELVVGTGHGGTVVVNATGNVEVSGRSPAGPSSALSTTTFGSGDGGEVFLRGNQIAIDDGGAVTSETSGSGRAGAISVDASRQVTIDNGRISTATSAAGAAGSIVIGTPLLAVSNGGIIDSSTTAAGNAGTVTANLDTLNVTGGGQIRSRSGVDGVVGTGNAGRVNLSATDSISVSGLSPDGTGSAVSTSTIGPANGGAITLNAGDLVEVTNGGAITADSIPADPLGGSGLAGDINVTSGQDIVLGNGGLVSTRAQTSDGGNINLSAPNVIQLTSSEISTSVESGLGGGGNINLDPKFITLNHSQIVANAFGGPGGNISLTATDGIIISPDSIISASSALSTQGTIEFNSPDTDVATGIAVLPASFLDVSRLLRGGCDTAGGRASSLGVASRSTLPVHPDSYLPSFGVAGLGAGTQTASATGDVQVPHLGGGAAAISLASIGCVM
jgi:filamentous hemagglutinin family protein